MHYLQDLLHIHETIFWVDASVRLQTSSVEHLHQRAVNLFDNSGHNVFMATHHTMYRYLPITKESAVNTTMYGAGAMFIRRNKQVEKVVLISRK